MSLPRLLVRRLHLVAAIVCALPFAVAGATAGAAQTSSASRAVPRAVPLIVEAVDENRLVTLTGNTRPEARAEFDRGRVAPNLAMGDLVLVLRRSPERQAAFEAFLASQQNPSSPNYHHWLTPDEIGQKFGPAQADIATVTGWLQNHGLAVVNVSKDHLAIRFSGVATQVESTFNTEIHNLQVRDEAHIANMSDPKIPEALSPVVVGVKALHNFFPKPLHTMGGIVRRNAQGGWERIADATAKPINAAAIPANSKQIHTLFNTGGTTSGAANIEDIAPYDFATIYNVLPLWNASTPIDGTGQTIAIAGTSNIKLSDVTSFRAAFGLPAYTSANQPKVVITNTDPGACPTFATTCQGDLVENTLDVEWSGAIAPKAQIILVTSSAPSATTDPLYVSEQYIVDNVTAQIMNVSYGLCELGLGTAGNQQYSNLWSTAQAAGIAVFVSTGDEGSASCDAGFDTSTPYGAQFGLSVSGIASTPYDTAVGGTDFDWLVDNKQATYWATSNDSTTKASALGYIPESPWNSTCSNPAIVDEASTAAKTTLTAAQTCDEIGIGDFGTSAYPLVDISGGSGGKSGCIDGDGATLASCTKGYAKPSWQAGVTGIPADGVRDIPDVSFFAANGFSGTAYVICVTGAGSCSYTADTEPAGEEVGGTSVASPIMAAVMALINQKAGSSQGNPNEALYKLAAKETYSGCSTEKIPLTGSSCVFNDIDTGTIAMPCDLGTQDCVGPGDTAFGVLSGYSSTEGFDLATGLGSMNVANLVNAYAASIAPSVTFAPTSLTFAGTLLGTSDATQTLTLKNTGTSDLDISGIAITGGAASSFSETNNCPATLPAGISCTITVGFKPAALGSLSATVSVTDNAAGSPQTATISGTGNESGTYALTASSVTIAHGSSGTSTITATGTASYTVPNTITLSACTLATAPTGASDLPGCTITTGTISIASGATTGTGTVTISTTAASAAAVKLGRAERQSHQGRWAAGGGVALAGLLLFCIPARSRKWRSMLGVLLFMVAIGVVSGCGGGSGSGGGGGTSDPGTTPGTYTFTVTGTDAAGVVEKATITVTVT